MKKILTLIAFALCIVPTFASAAFNDATLTTDAIISVGGYTLNISGSSAVIESITVSSDSFSVTLGSGSSFVVSSASLNELNPDAMTGVTKVCTGSASSLTLASQTTIVITPSATICSDAATSSSVPPSSSSGGGSRGGGGGGSVPVVTPTATPTPVPGCPINTVCIRAPGTSNTFSFSRDLSMGMTGLDVKSLQIFLNTHGFPIAASGIGSLGNETDIFGGLTKQALIKFQQANSISPTGYFGPLTRARVTSFGASNTVTPAAVAPSSPSTGTFTRNLTAGDVNAEVLLLQRYLNTHGFVIVTTGPGSPGQETSTFGGLTKQALIKFQQSKGLPATGFFGPMTRAVISGQ